MKLFGKISRKSLANVVFPELEAPERPTTTAFLSVVPMPLV